MVTTTSAPTPTTENHGPVTAAAMATLVQRASQDPWQCHTETMEQYFEFPMVSGALSTAFISYRVDKMSTYCDRPKTDWHLCDTLPDSVWCAFTTAAPKSLLPVFSAHVSSAYTWSSEHSASLAVLPTKCPDTWDRARNDVILDGQAWLNETLSQASCYKDFQEKGEHGTGGQNQNTESQDSEGQSQTTATKDQPKTSETKAASKENKAGPLRLSKAVICCTGLIWCLIW